ncbi:hypothetical protein DFH09DRAFT_1248874 [Mycena vulgaris]|nr:hypothetical protein DFH09DRAFT_1248874 [Mycena vulgaris]
MSLPSTTRQFFYREFGSFNTLALEVVPLSPPKPNEVLVRTHAVSLQFRDLMISHEGYGGFIQPNLVPCSDMAGEVIAVGADVIQWKVGDRVSPNFMLGKIHDELTPEIAATALGRASHGVLTEYKAFPAHTATLPCAALTAYNALTAGHSPVKAGDTILVLGTGGVSTFALQFTVASGATVITLSSSDDKLKEAKKFGAKHVINYKTTPNWDEEVLKLTSGVGVDRVIEVRRGKSTLKRSLSAVKMNGSIDIIGAANTPPVDIVFHTIRKSLNIRGIFVGSVKQGVFDLCRFKDMNKLISANVELTRPVVDKVFPFEEAKAAFAYFESQAHVGKVVIKLR